MQNKFKNHLVQIYKTELRSWPDPYEQDFYPCECPAEHAQVMRYNLIPNSEEVISIEDTKIITPACHIQRRSLGIWTMGGKCSFEFPKFSLWGDIVPIDRVLGYQSPTAVDGYKIWDH